jgi:hypothetical protein
MSGSRTHHHDWPTTPGQDCNIVFKTPLNSTDENVLRLLQPNSVLNVEIVVESGRKLVAAIHPQHGFAGVITATQAATILGCLEKGFLYQAVVVSIKPPACQVEVRPRQT